MENAQDNQKSNIERIKDVAVYAPLGVIGFVKDNAPAFINIVVSKGKSQISGSNTKDSEQEDEQDQSIKAKFQRATAKQTQHITSDFNKSKNFFYSAVGFLGFAKDTAPKVEPLLNDKGQKDVRTGASGVTDNVKEKLSAVKDRIPFKKTVEKQEDPEDIVDITVEEKNIVEKAIDQTLNIAAGTLNTVVSTVNSVIGKVFKK